jgi:[protein-PII] uridylyltransferase
LRCAHVDTFGSPSRVTPLCVVADDRPGLLWLISAALAAHRLDVVKAHIYCRRRPDGRTEALDLIWVRRASASSGEGALTANEITAIDELLEALILGHAETRESVEGEVLNPAVAEPNPPRVTFLVDAESNASMLAIEAPDRPGLLLTITRALFEEGVQITRAEVVTIDARALDTFYVMVLDGGAISPERRAQIAIAAQTALTRLY